MGIGGRAAARRMVAPALAIALLAAACSGEDADDGASPTTTIEAVDPTTTTTEAQTRTTVADPVAIVTGPIEGGTHGVPYNPAPPALLDEHGYVEQEFFVAGTAPSAPSAPLGVDGAWAVQASTSAPYTTRILVRRPADAKDFSGMVFVEWLNVTSGMDSDPDFGQGHPELLRSGAAYVGVSAQAVGVMGGGARIPIEGFDPRALREWDPARYGALSHPGDEYSYDIFTQAAQVLRAPGAVDPLDGLEPEIVLAGGESQSASRLVTYIDAVQPLAGVFDGFLVHSRGRGGAALGPDVAPPAGARIRGDLAVPVLVVQTETDLFRLGSFEARQPDTDRIRTWEIAGTAHADAHTLEYGLASGAVWNPAGAVDLSALCGSVNDGPQTFVIRSAIAALDRWARDGELPPVATPIETADGAIVRDELGIARGGIRTPAVDVPVSTLSGDPPAGSSVICSLFGSSTALPADVLIARYPTREDYVTAVRASAEGAVAAGFLLAADVEEIVAIARATSFPPA
jgi:hypothetical protein